MGYTKGPWKVIEPKKGIPLVTPESKINDITFNWMPRVEGELLNRNIEEVRANARLIAAAPELLEACRDLSYWSDQVNSLQHAGLSILPSTWVDLYQATNKAKAAIAKAEGRA